ncbi:MAG: 30S ribosomal protein S8 [Aquificaceae bacterium]
MDPIADMFSAIKNGIQRRKESIEIPSSKVKEAILEVLKREGFIANYERLERKVGTQPFVRISFKYLDSKRERSAIEDIQRVSKPGRRVYKPKHQLPYVEKGFGIAIISTDSGIVTDHEARKLGKGGEIIAFVR